MSNCYNLRLTDLKGGSLTCMGIGGLVRLTQLENQKCAPIVKEEPGDQPPPQVSSLDTFGSFLSLFSKTPQVSADVDPDIVVMDAVEKEME